MYNIGDIWGKLELVKIHEKCINKVKYGTFQCYCLNKDCKGLVKQPIFKVKKGYIVSCGIGQKKIFDDYEEIAGFRWNSIVKSAKSRNIIFNLSIEEAWELYLKQDKKCNLTGWPIGFEYSKDRSGRNKICTASLDRIDNSDPRGYHIENVQWLHKDVNYLKNKFDQNYFISICKAINNWRG